MVFIVRHKFYVISRNLDRTSNRFKKVPRVNSKNNSYDRLNLRKRNCSIIYTNLKVNANALFEKRVTRSANYTINIGYYKKLLQKRKEVLVCVACEKNKQ